MRRTLTPASVSRSEGFTLIELLVVILIIGVLVAVAAPSFLGQTKKAQDSSAKQYLTLAYKAERAAAAGGTALDAAQIASAINTSEPALDAFVDSEAACEDEANPGYSNNRQICVADNSTNASAAYCSLSDSDTLFCLTAGTGSSPTFAVPNPPVNTALPVVSGTAEVGQTMSTNDGTWSGATPMTFAYAWLRCDAAGANCLAIAGATSSTYSVVSGDIGQTLRSRVTATNAYGAPTATSNATLVVPDPATMGPPVNTGLPAVSGTAEVGQTLTGSNGTWNGAQPIVYTHEWLRCNSAGNSCAAIAGATNSTYTVVSADVGQTLRVRVTATNAQGAPTATSGQTAVVPAPVPVNTSPPSINGAPFSGWIVSASNGFWDNSPTSFAYQWRRCAANGTACANIAGATNQSYTVAGADVGNSLRVVVTASNAAGAGAPATSAHLQIQG